MPHWTDIIQACASIVTAGATLYAFVFVRRQIIQLDRSIRGTTHEALYAQQQSISQYFVEHPEIRDRFRSKDAVPGDLQMNAVAEMFADFYEHVALQQSNLPPDVWKRWVAYMCDVYKGSAALRQHLETHQHWYANELLDVFKACPK